MTEALHFEGIKYAYRQNKDGVVVSFVVHPNDIPPSLATSHIGARYIVALVEIGDDEQPKLGKEAMPNNVSSERNNAPPRQSESLRTAGAVCIAKAMGGDWCIGKCRDARDCSATPQGVLAKAKREWRDKPPQQQAGIRCGEPLFLAFLKEERPNDWREAANPTDCVRMICGVISRSELGTNQKARVIWHQLDEQYLTWAALERAS